jgi:WD40 repeat protein
LRTSKPGLIIIRCLIACFLFVMLAAGGCKDNPADEGSQAKTPLSIDELIVSPKAPAPADTVMLSAVVTSNSPNVGDFPSYAWTVEAGTLLESNKPLVRWLAPGTSRIYEVSVSVSNSVSTVHRSEEVFVRHDTTVVSSFAGEVRLLPGGNGVYYLYSTRFASDDRFTGFTISRWQEGGAAQRITTAMAGLEYEFSPDISYAVHAYTVPGFYDDNPINIVIDDLPSGAQTVITRDEAFLYNRRRNQYTSPSISIDGTLIAFQAFKGDLRLPDVGGVDTFRVNVYNKNTAQTMIILSDSTHINGSRDFHPSFSSDGQYLTVISNRNASVGWELFGFPVSGGTVDTLAANIRKLSDTGGLIASGSPPDKPKRAWNPNSAHPYLAIVGGDKKLWLVGTDGTSGIVSGISGTVNSMAWSSDGTRLAVASGNVLYIASLDRTARAVYTSLASDVINDLTWIDNDRLILYNLKRLNNMWFELADVDGSGIIPVALKVTPKIPVGRIAGYRDVCSMGAAWHSNAEIYTMVFSQDTPGVLWMDLSSLFN